MVRVTRRCVLRLAGITKSAQRYVRDSPQMQVGLPRRRTTNHRRVFSRVDPARGGVVVARTGTGAAASSPATGASRPAVPSATKAVDSAPRDRKNSCDSRCGGFATAEQWRIESRPDRRERFHLLREASPVRLSAWFAGKISKLGCIGCLGGELR